MRALTRQVLTLVLLAAPAPAGMAPDPESAPGTLEHVPYLVRLDQYASDSPNGIPTPRCRNDGDPDLFQAINRLLGLRTEQPQYLLSNSEADSRWVGGDDVWMDPGGIVVLVGGTASFHDVLGLYTDPGEGRKRVPLLPGSPGFGFRADGTRRDPYPAAWIPRQEGRRFGWYLEVDGSAFGVEPAVLFSESGLNPEGQDHLFTYALEDVFVWVDPGDGPVPMLLDRPFLIGWEDAAFGARAFDPGDVDGRTFVRLLDEDYDDVIFLVGEGTLLALR